MTELKVFVTKYALTSGILVFEKAELCNPKMVSVREPGRLCMYFHGNDWHTTWESAEADAYRRVDRKIKSIAKQMAKLEEMTFTNPDIKP